MSVNVWRAQWTNLILKTGGVSVKQPRCCWARFASANVAAALFLFGNHSGTKLCCLFYKWLTLNKYVTMTTTIDPTDEMPANVPAPEAMTEAQATSFKANTDRVCGSEGSQACSMIKCPHSCTRMEGAYIFKTCGTVQPWMAYRFRLWQSYWQPWGQGEEIDPVFTAN